MNWVSPVLTVRNASGSLRFYTDVLGFHEWFRWGGSKDEPATTGVVRGNARVILDGAGPKGVPDRTGTGVEIYFDVGDADVDAYYEQVQAKGARIVEPIADKPWGDRLFRIADLDGYQLAFAKTMPASSER